MHKKIKCELCEYNKCKAALEIHHIDGNHNNNVASNRLVLCANCHRETHYTPTHKLYKKSGRIPMREVNKCDVCGIQPKNHQNFQTCMSYDNKKCSKTFCLCKSCREKFRHFETTFPLSECCYTPKEYVEGKFWEYYDKIDVSSYEIGTKMSDVINKLKLSNTSGIIK